jgi:HUS1 checkpoint protein
LKSTKGALGCTIKLIRHEDKPALLFSITHRSRANILQTIKQQIPAQVIAPGSGDDISEPNLPSPHVFIMAPSLPILRAHVEKLRTLDKFVYVGANMRGRFSLRYQNNELEVQTEWTGLLHPEPGKYHTFVHISTNIYDFIFSI